MHVTPVNGLPAGWVGRHVSGCGWVGAGAAWRVGQVRAHFWPVQPHKRMAALACTSRRPPVLPSGLRSLLFEQGGMHPDPPNPFPAPPPPPPPPLPLPTRPAQAACPWAPHPPASRSIMVSSAAVPPPSECPMIFSEYPGLSASACSSSCRVWPLIHRAAASMPKWEYPSTTPFASTRWCGLEAPAKGQKQARRSHVVGQGSRAGAEPAGGLPEHPPPGAAMDILRGRALLDWNKTRPHPQPPAPVRRCHADTLHNLRQRAEGAASLPVSEVNISLKEWVPRMASTIMRKWRSLRKLWGVWGVCVAWGCGGGVGVGCMCVGRVG